jgi:hypothetical protein
VKYCAYGHSVATLLNPRGVTTVSPQVLSNTGFLNRGSARDRDEKTKNRFLNLLAKINRSTEKYHSLLKRTFDYYYWIIISTTY